MYHTNSSDICWYIHKVQVELMITFYSVKECRVIQVSFALYNFCIYVSWNRSVILLPCTQGKIFRYLSIKVIGNVKIVNHIPQWYLQISFFFPLDYFSSPAMGRPASSPQDSHCIPVLTAAKKLSFFLWCKAWKP